MEYRQLGRSGLRVSTLTLGTMTFGGTGWASVVGNTDVDGARRQIAMALDAGVNLIDTADVYSGGLSEEIIAKALPVAREDVLLATKVRMPMGDGPNDAGLSRHHIVRACEASLRRLGSEYIDLYQVHEWDGQTPLEETMRALDDLVTSGKVRYIGASNYAGWQLMKALGVAEREHLSRFASQQIYYSLAGRDAERELVPLSIDQGLGILVWSPLAAGLLSGKYARGVDAPAGSRQLSDWNEPPIDDREKLYDTVDVLKDVAAGHGVSAAQIALAWSLGRPGVTSLIVGARTDEQLADNLKAADVVLSADERRMLDDVSKQVLPYPHWHQAKTAHDRLSAADLALLAPYIS
ncbi:MAG TPA: aldo/keto reductase [Acidothermaceae bacterium]